MRPINVVLAHRDQRAAETLAGLLRKQFRNLTVAASLEETRSAVARMRAPFAVLDLELVGFAEVKQLCSEFPSTAFVCMHRLADEAIWAEALSVGAVDCCLPGDLNGILQASERYVEMNQHAAAA